MPKPPVDIDWLISRFNSVSEKYPGLVLVGLESPKKFTSINCTVPDPEWGMRFPNGTSEGEYGHQYHYANGIVVQEPQGIQRISLAPPLLAFPQWCFGSMDSPVLKNGWWAMWLHRKFGFDPEVTDAKQNLSSNAECLASYNPILEIATDILIQFYGTDEWFFESGVLSEGRPHEKFSRCGPWLLFLLSCFRSRKESDGRHVIDDVGIASLMVLRSLRDGLDGQTESPPQASAGSRPQNNLRDFTEGELRDALDALLNKAARYYTAKAAADELNKRNPDRKIGPSRVGACQLWKEHARQWGKQRAPRNTSKEAANIETRRLAAQQKRNMDADEGKRVKGNRIQGTD